MIRFWPLSVEPSKWQRPPFCLTAPVASNNQLDQEKFYPGSTNFDWLPVLPVAWFCPESNYIFFWAFFTNLYEIWGDFIFFSERVFGLELIIFVGINQNCMGFIIGQIWQCSYYCIIINKDILKNYLHYLLKRKYFIYIPKMSCRETCRQDSSRV